MEPQAALQAFRRHCEVIYDNIYHPSAIIEVSNSLYSHGIISLETLVVAVVDDFYVSLEDKCLYLLIDVMSAIEREPSNFMVLVRILKSDHQPLADLLLDSYSESNQVVYYRLINLLP